MITDKCPPPDWNGFDEGDSRDTLPTALAERVEYVMAVVSNLSPELRASARELSRLRRLCRELELPEQEVRHVFDAVGDDMPASSR